jgi:hypothetical protein
MYSAIALWRAQEYARAEIPMLAMRRRGGGRTFPLASEEAMAEREFPRREGNGV